MMTREQRDFITHSFCSHARKGLHLVPGRLTHVIFAGSQNVPRFVASSYPRAEVVGLQKGHDLWLFIRQPRANGLLLLQAHHPL